MKKDRKNEIEELAIDFMETHNFGDVVSYKYFERIFGVSKEEVEYYLKMKVLKEILSNFGCVLQNVLNEGYKIIEPKNIADFVYRKYAKTSLNRLKKGLKIMNVIDRNLLNDEEKKRHNDFEKVIAILCKDNENTLLSSQALLNATKQKELNK